MDSTINGKMSIVDYTQLQAQLIRLGYQLLKSSFDAPGDNARCECCGSQHVFSITLFTHKAATPLSRGWDGAQPFELPLYDGRMFDICVSCWNVFEVFKTADGEPDEN